MGLGFNLAPLALLGVGGNVWVPGFRAAPSTIRWSNLAPLALSGLFGIRHQAVGVLYIAMLPEGESPKGYDYKANGGGRRTEPWNYRPTPSPSALKGRD